MKQFRMTDDIESIDRLETFESLFELLSITASDTQLAKLMFALHTLDIDAILNVSDANNVVKHKTSLRIIRVSDDIEARKNVVALALTKDEIIRTISIMMLQNDKIVAKTHDSDVQLDSIIRTLRDSLQQLEQEK